MTDDSLVFASAKPDVEALISTYKECTPLDAGWHRIQDSDNVRFCRWSGQTKDAKKHGTTAEKAMPWEGASDAIVPVADRIIQELASIKTMAFWRAMLRVGPVGTEDIEQSSQASKLLKWVTQVRLNHELGREVELSANYWDAYGWSVLKVTWNQEIQLQNKDVDLEKIIVLAQQMAQMDPSSPFVNLPALIMDPEQDEASATVFGQLAQSAIQAASADSLHFTPKPLTQSSLKRMVRELRETGKTTVPVPYLCRNDPCITALKPWEDVFVPRGTAELQRAPVIFHRILMSEVELRSKVADEGWDQDFVEEAVKTKGRFLMWPASTKWQDELNNRLGLTTIEIQNDLIELLYCYTRALDENGVPAIYETVIQPTIQNGKNKVPSYGKHEMLPYHHNQYPFVVGCKEQHCRDITASRGVPERVRSRQREIKVQRDSIVDHTSISTLPPVLAPMTGGPRPGGGQGQFRFGPAVELPYRTGYKPEFMQPPPHPGLAFELMQTVEIELANEFGLISNLVPPARSMALQQKETTEFLRMWSSAFKQMFSLLRQYMSPEQWERITGSQKPPENPVEIERSYDLILSFDVRELDIDHMKEKLQAITGLAVPMDRGGIMDNSKLVQVILQAIDPSLVSQLVQDPAAASEKIYRQVQTDMLTIFNGDEPIYTDTVDPTAGRQLEYAQQIVFGGPNGGGNPEYQKKLQDQRTQELFEKWVKNKQQSMKQQENKMVGRTGVQPMTR